MSVYYYLGGSIEQSLFLKIVDEEDIIITEEACTQDKSSDFEDISILIVAKVINVICKPLKHIYNTSLRTSVSHKKSNCLSNNIYVLQQFSKVFQQLFLVSIYSVKANNILSWNPVTGND